MRDRHSPLGARFPEDYVRGRDTAVLLHLMVRPEMNRYDDIVDALECAGWSRPSKSTVSACLHRLRGRGLVDWEDRKQRTLRATVTALQV